MNEQSRLLEELNAALVKLASTRHLIDAAWLQLVELRGRLVAEIATQEANDE